MSNGAADAVVSGDALLLFDADMRVVHCNRAAEELLDVSAAEMLGKPCWDALAGRDERGAPLCQPGCSHARAAREGWPVPYVHMVVPTRRGPRSLAVSTLLIRGANGNGPVVCRVLREERRPGGNGHSAVRLSARQLEVLGLVADGLPARRIARRLGIAESTVRNHIRAVLVELGAHSQLEAVARAREFGLL